MLRVEAQQAQTQSEVQKISSVAVRPFFCLQGYGTHVPAQDTLPPLLCGILFYSRVTVFLAGP